MAPGFFVPPAGASLLAMIVNDDAGHLMPHRELAPTGFAVSGGLGVEVQHAHACQQIRFRQIRMLMTAQCAVHQPVTILDIEGKAADEGLLFVAVCDEVEAILVFGVEHDAVRVGFEGRQTGAIR